LIEDACATLTERSPHFLDLISLAVERTAHHQEDATRLEPSRLLSDGLGRGRAEHHFVHLAEDDSSGLGHVFSFR
jgi:hypothetical protein